MIAVFSAIVAIATEKSLTILATTGQGFHMITTTATIDEIDLGKLSLSQRSLSQRSLRLLRSQESGFHMINMIAERFSYGNQLKGVLSSKFPGHISPVRKNK